jgi:phage-related tail protein
MRKNAVHTNTVGFNLVKDWLNDNKKSNPKKYVMYAVGKKWDVLREGRALHATDGAD